MFFEMSNSPATIQTMMNALFYDLHNPPWVVIAYMDDILTFTKTLDEHRKIVGEVLQILKTNHLYLKPEKCKFECAEIDCLGMIIRVGSIRRRLIETIISISFVISVFISYLLHNITYHINYYVLLYHILLTPSRHSQTRLIHKDYLSSYPIPQNILSHSSEFYTSPKLLVEQYI